MRFLNDFLFYTTFVQAVRISSKYFFVNYITEISLVVSHSSSKHLALGPRTLHCPACLVGGKVTKFPASSRRAGLREQFGLGHASAIRGHVECEQGILGLFFSAVHSYCSPQGTRMTRQPIEYSMPVSYTHLTLPTIYSV